MLYGHLEQFDIYLGRCAACVGGGEEEEETAEESAKKLRRGETMQGFRAQQQKERAQIKKREDPIMSQTPRTLGSVP
jgi:hypothetical protein